MATRIAPRENDAADKPADSGWTIESARNLYNIEGWGAGFFDLKEQGISLPVLLRFSDILRSRIEALTTRFQQAREEFGYTGGYTTVYPIKVNQQRHVVEEIVEFGKAHAVGLECGSKPQLQAVLALAEHTDHLIVCNG